MKKPKLTGEELQKYTTANSNYYMLRSRLTDIVLTEERLKNDKQSTLINIELAQDELGKVNSEIHEKYGPGKVNMETGEIVAS